MSGAGWVSENLGLAVLSALSVALIAYLAWVMIHPERF